MVVADAVQGPDGARGGVRGRASAGAGAGASRADGASRDGRASVARIAMGDARVRLRESGAVAVDMESVWLAPGAGERPFAVVRVISDTPARELTRPAGDGGGRGARDGRAAPRGGCAARVDAGGLRATAMRACSPTGIDAPKVTRWRRG